MQAQLAEARIHVQIDVGFGDAITPAATDLEFPTLLGDMPSPNVLAYPTETIVAEKAEAMVDLDISNSRMAAKAGMSHTMVGRIWRNARSVFSRTSRTRSRSRPIRSSWTKCVTSSACYINPPHNAVAFAVDEKSQIQALQRAQPILPMDLGQPERRTHNYIRHGTLDLFAALNIATGEVLARCKPQHRAQDFVAFLREIEASVAPALEVHVVLDNLSAHKAPAVHRWLLRHPRVHFHFTPTYASWLNLVERFFGLFTEKAVEPDELGEELPRLRTVDDAAETRVLMRDADASVQHDVRQEPRMALGEPVCGDGQNALVERHRSSSAMFAPSSRRRSASSM